MALVSACILGDGEAFSAEATAGGQRVADGIDPGTLTGKLIMGYQGWFSCPGDPGGWGHWGDLAHATPTVDMLPDLSDFPQNARCVTPMKTPDGHRVELFSSLNPATEEQHFAWMQQYGLDGVALQRFATWLKPPLVQNVNRVLENVRRAAEHHGRVFFVMYDLSGMTPANILAVAKDWEQLERDGLTASPAYLHHRGHPLLALWGLGFEGRPLTPKDASTLLDVLATASALYGGVTVMGGLPSYWRSRDRDASPDAGWEQVWKRLGVISPWAVGRFGDDAGADVYRRTVLEPDIKATHALGVDYMPVVFPGFSWANLMHARQKANTTKSNAIPRRCGRFYWRQVYNALSVGSSALYGAMFDEVDEGTAMFKLLPNAAGAPTTGLPPGDAFVTLDADGCRLPSDWYLRLAGAATSALRSGVLPSSKLPLPLLENSPIQ